MTVDVEEEVMHQQVGGGVMLLLGLALITSFEERVGVSSPGGGVG